MTRLLALAFACGLCTMSAAQPKPNEAKAVTVCFLGGAKKVPLEGLKVTIRGHTGDWTKDRKNRLMEGTTNKDGQVGFTLTDGDYYVDIASEKELPYLNLPVGYTRYPGYYDRLIKVGKETAFTFNLADACRLTLRVVDADTGKAIPGIELVTENALGEIWGQEIGQDNLGAKPIRERDPRYRTDKDGTLVRLVGPRPGYTYYPWTELYEVVGKWEVEVPTPIGTLTAEHTFKLRKKAK